MKLEKGLKFIENIDELSAMPAIALDVMGMLNDPFVSVRDIVNKTMLDPAMVSYVLKSCNSPLYGIRSEVTSIPIAVNLLGYTNLKSILMAYFIRNLYRLSGKNEIKVKLWRHSIAVAVFSKNIAQEIHADVDESYVAGLLHDIGKMVLYLDDNLKYEEIIQLVDSGTMNFITAEKKSLEFTHVDTGYFLLEKWKFSQLLKDVVLFHHDPQMFLGKNKIIGLVAFADQLTHVFMEKRFDNLDHFLETLGLKEKDVDKLVETSLPTIEELYNIL